eukprot:SAG31_NODE_3601_length_4085_cov_1.880582_1_plen_40_part_10
MPILGVSDLGLPTVRSGSVINWRNAEHAGIVESNPGMCPG